jgi:Tfp pilus assembly protein FimT
VLFVIALCGILSTLFLNGWNNFNENQNIHFVEQQLRSAIATARLQAAIHASDSKIVPVQDNWNNGIEVLVLRSVNGSRVWRKQFMMLYKKSRVQVDWKGFQSKDYISFRFPFSSMAANGVFTLQKGSRSIQIIVNRIGLSYSKTA